MRIPPRLMPLYEDGLIDEVLPADERQGGHGVRGPQWRGDPLREGLQSCAAQFQAGGQVPGGSPGKNSRRARAMEKGSKFGRKQLEASWQNAEVDALYRRPAPA